MTLISVDHEKCNRDGLWVSECPTRIIVMDPETVYPVHTPDFKDLCLKCGHCVTVCPSEALRVDWLAPEECPAIMKERVVTSEQAMCSKRRTPILLYLKLLGCPLITLLLGP